MNPEILVAVLPLNKVIGLSKLSVNKSDAVKATKFDDNIKKYTLDILKGKQVNQPMTIKLSEAEDIIKKVKDMSVDERMKTIAPVADVGVIGPMSELLTYLQETLPETEGSSELTRYIWKCRIVDNTLWILHLISNSQLTPIDVECIERVYPDIYQAITQSFVNNIVEEMIEIESLKRHQKMMLSMLLKTPVLDDVTIKAYQISDNVKPTNLKVQ